MDCSLCGKRDEPCRVLVVGRRGVETDLGAFLGADDGFLGGWWVISGGGEYGRRGW